MPVTDVPQGGAVFRGSLVEHGVPGDQGGECTYSAGPAEGGRPRFRSGIDEEPQDEQTHGEEAESGREPLDLLLVHF